MTLKLALLASVLFAPAFAFAQDKDTVDEVVVVSPAPMAGGVSISRLGSAVERVGADDFDRTGSLSATDALQRSIPGVNVTDTQGNGSTGDVNYRGFVASPVQGAPQGLALYMNGQRLNEAFGDTVNWDLIPQNAIASADLFTNNPAFGLNALGGAINLRMKDGFSYKGSEIQVQGGENSFWSGAAQGGWSNDKASLFAAIDGGSDDGWRQQSASEILRGFVDVGVKAEGGEWHLIGGASHSTLGVVGPTPADLLEADRTSVYTFPQTSENKARFVALNGAAPLGGGWTVQGGVNYRRFEQDHVDGNDGEFERCSSATTGVNAPFRNTLCLEDDFIPAAIRPGKGEFQILTLAGQPIPCPTLLSNPAAGNGCAPVPYGTVDRTATRTTTTAASAQAARDADLMGRKNTFTVGASYSDSDIHFQSSNTLAVITPELEVTDDPATTFALVGPIAGLGQAIQAGTGAIGYGPADVTSGVRHTGVFVSDTFDLAGTLSLTVGGRYNQAKVDLHDETGRSPNLNTGHAYSRFNPATTLAWRPAEGLTVFGGYSETNRAPTPLELGCSDPVKPCLLENSLVADPPLDQVKSKTAEAGFRYARRMGGARLTGSANVFNTQNDNDIVSVASDLIGRGYYANVPRTKRQGFEGEIAYETQAWSVFAGYAYVAAEYRFDGTIASPNNPQADANGDIEISSGDRIGGIPANRGKFGATLRPLAALSLTLDAQYIGSAYFVGDEGNDNDKLESYWTSNFRADYEVSETVRLFARVTNLLDKDYATYGTYFEAEGTAKVSPNPLPLDPQEATLTPAAPRTFYVGLKARF